MSTKYLLLSVATIGTLIGSAAPPTCLAAPTWPQEQADKQDSVSPQRHVPQLAAKQQQMRIDSAKRQNTEDLVKLMKVQPGMNMVGGINTVGNQKNRTRPKYGINN